jgi:hypothetical protein
MNPYSTPYYGVNPYTQQPRGMVLTTGYVVPASPQQKQMEMHYIQSQQQMLYQQQQLLLLQQQRLEAEGVKGNPNMSPPPNPPSSQSNNSPRNNTMNHSNGGPSTQRMSDRGGGGPNGGGPYNPKESCQTDCTWNWEAYKCCCQPTKCCGGCCKDGQGLGGWKYPVCPVDYCCCFGFTKHCKLCLLLYCCPICTLAKGLSSLDGRPCPLNCIFFYCLCGACRYRYHVRRSEGIPGSCWEDVYCTYCCPATILQTVRQQENITPDKVLLF